ncbi:hypothetical protein B7463_g5615, partial [Scytalidium lignicola]
MESHKEAVSKISERVRGYSERGEKFRIFHGSTNSTRHTKKGNLVDTSSLNHVLKVDTSRKTALVEPNVPMDRLVEATMKHGLVPYVVMEFPGITVGGGYSGTSGESSSFKHGFFNHTIDFVEMVLANGEVVTASKTQNPDLFHGAAGAVGTLGVTTLVELQLQEAKKYVETTYHPVSSMAEAIGQLKKFTADKSINYVDGIMYSKTHGAIITGTLTNDTESSIPVQQFSNARDPWFYLHEAIPLAEYLFRYDRGGFWVGASAFKYFRTPFNKFTRWFLDDFLHTRMMYTALHASGQSKRYVVQDLALPYSTAEKFVDYTDKAFGIYPLWLCPLKQSPVPTMHPHNSSQKNPDGSLEDMLNIGLWGDGPEKHEDFVALNRDLEYKLRELGGMKWLYAHTYYSEDEFWQQFDRKWYDDLRNKYGATTLPSVYEKVKVDVEAERNALTNSSFLRRLLVKWPLSGFWGIWKAIQNIEQAANLESVVTVVRKPKGQDSNRVLSRDTTKMERSGSILLQDEAAPPPASEPRKQKKKKVLLMGKSGSGKSSMRSIIFSNYVAKDTRRLGATIDVDLSHVKFLGNLTLNLWDCGGQDAFMENYLSQQRQHVFSNVAILIYVFDIESRDFDRDLLTYRSIINALSQFSPSSNIYILVHKMDLVVPNQREDLYNDRVALIRSKSEQFTPIPFATSIWDQSLYKAWAEIIHDLVPNLDEIERHLSSLGTLIQAEEVLLFERSSFLVVSSWVSKIGELNPTTDRFERLSNIIKNFKQSTSRYTGTPKSAEQFILFELKLSFFSMFIVKFTTNTYLAVILPPGEERFNAAVENAKLARKEFEDLDSPARRGIERGATAGLVEA